MKKNLIKVSIIASSFILFTGCGSETPSNPSNPDNPTITDPNDPKELKVSISGKNEIYNDEDLLLFADTGSSEIKSYLWENEKGDELGTDKQLLIQGPFDLGTYIYKLTVVDEEDVSKTVTFRVNVKDSKYKLTDNNIQIFVADMSSDNYVLPQVDDNQFNSLSLENKYIVAEKLLNSMFFSFDKDELTSLIKSGEFISSIKEKLKDETNDMDTIEEYISDKNRYYQSEYVPEVKMLARFYEMKDLDKSYFNHWMSYILTQTIMFSPAVELDTVSRSDIYGVYNRLFTLINNEIGMRYTSFQHMISDENWRRFRSPEDNGREMLEIFAFDEDDKDVPIAAQALKNWHLSKDGETLVVGLNKNTEPLTIKGEMHFTTGMEFYSSLANSSYFTKGVIQRIVDFMLIDTNENNKRDIVNKILNSHPETWGDIFKQLIFSEEYLLNTTRPKGMEEIAFPLMKKLSFNSRYGTFGSLRNALINMNQASMAYKLGKLDRVPVDSNSFATAQKYLRELVLRRWSRDTENSVDPAKKDATHNSTYYMNHFKTGEREGVSSKIFMSNNNFDFNEDDNETSVESYINYLSQSVLNRDLTTNEMRVLKEHILPNYYGKYITYKNENDLDKQEYIRTVGKYNIQYVVFEYFLRLESMYIYKEVK